jgi:hypothetical protein
MKTPLALSVLALAWISSLFAADAGKETATASDSGRVPFPADYQKYFEEIRASNKTGQTQLGTIYANLPAANVRETRQLPYPYGSVIVMEWAEPVKGSAGELLTDANGNWKKGAVVRVDVMRREKGFGAAYGEKRAGEWEFASFTPDGRAWSPTPNFTSCAECHSKAAARDFVFRGRFPAMENN